MRNLVCAAATCAVILASLGGAMAAGEIAARQEAMKGVGGAMKAIKAAVEGDKAADAVGPAEKIVATMKTYPDLFPKGSDVGETDAKPEIWDEWDKFKMAAANAGEAAGKLAMVAATGDAAATGEAMKALGGACGGCHKPYRKPKT